MQMQRHWINAPSTLQPVHKWHGARVLADKKPDSMVTVYFTEGPTISAIIPSRYLAEGWPQGAIVVH
jgi:hypothetical protein